MNVLCSFYGKKNPQINHKCSDFIPHFEPEWSLPGHHYAAQSQWHYVEERGIAVSD